MRVNRVAMSLLFAMSVGLLAQSGEGQGYEGQNWTHYVRTSGHGLTLENAAEIVAGAAQTHIFGIEVDNSLTGYYESFMDPAEKLAALEKVTRLAHQAGNKVFVYTEGLETITSNADQKPHTFFKDHPDWVQRDINGRPAVFGGGDAFWIAEGDEDVWISPYAMEWRTLFMERIRQIAATGIDGVFVDIPYWMTHFEGWEDTWASFDEYTRAAFKAVSGLDAKTDLKLGDFDDPNFRRWVDFRIRTLTDFMAEVAENGRSVNPDFKTIAEIYPGIEEAAVRVGADVYQMYEVVDVVAHEYSAGGYTAAERSPLDWFADQVGMLSFRAFAGDKATWMLSYSWDNHQEVPIPEAMDNLMMAQVMVGANCWDARGHVMSGSNDLAHRTRLFQWIATHEKTFYRPRTPINPVGVYFSPQTRNYFADDYIPVFRGLAMLFLQGHREFQIVTPRTLADFKGETLILDEVKCLSREEGALLKSFVENGGDLWLAGDCGSHDQTGAPLSAEGGRAIADLAKEGGGRLAQSRGEAYYAALRKGSKNVATLREEFFEHLDARRKSVPAMRVDAPSTVSATMARVDGRPHLFLSNFTGLVAKKNAAQKPVKGVTVTFPGAGGQVYCMPFMGEVTPLKSRSGKDGQKVTLPDIKKGMVVWIEPQKP